MNLGHDARGLHVLLAAVLAGTFLAGCCKKSESNPNPSGTGTAVTVSTTLPPAVGEWITHQPSNSKFMAPVGWTQKKDDNTIVFIPPEGKAVLAFESYDTGSDPSATIMTVARKLHLLNLDWKGGTKAATFGKDNIPGQFADGTCTYNGESSGYSYATLNPGGVKKILIIYAVQQSAPANRKQEAINTVKSIQKL